MNKIRNYSDILIGRPIAIPYFPARKITAKSAAVRRAFNRLFYLRVPPRTLRLNSLFGCSMLHVTGSSHIVKFSDNGFRYISSYQKSIKPAENQKAVHICIDAPNFAKHSGPAATP